jgi:choline dehydrogenase-like flavoprotein
MAKAFDKQNDGVVVVIGSGAGGGTLSSELASAGIDVVCLEAGEPVERIETDAKRMFGRLTWFDKRIGSGDLPADFPVWSGKNVGGTTLHWTGSTPRIPEPEMTPRRYLSSLAGCSVIDWPVPYAELQRFYALAERAMGVSGTHDWPRLPGNNNFRVLQAGGRRAGLQRIEVGNMAINSVAHEGRSACLQLGFCVSGCAVQAKWTAANTPIAQALETEHFELRPRSFVLRIETDAAGRASEVVYVDAQGARQRQRARAVCVAANAIDTPRILLNSDSSRFPQGLANRSGHVGRNYMKHVFSIVTAIMPKPVHFHRGTQNSGKVYDFVAGDTARGFAGGFAFEQVAFDPASLARLARPGAWGQEYAAQIRKYDHFAALLVMGEDPAQPTNRVTLHAIEKDQYGMPVPVVHYVDHPNSRAMRTFAQARAREIYAALGSRDVFFGPPPPATHNMGTCRMAPRAEDGVCDASGRTFDVPNLFVSDGSMFSSSGSSNPTLTIVALALRQAAHITAAMRQGKL